MVHQYHIATLSPIIMEVEHGCFWKVTTIGDTPIFDFHDYGRKGNWLVVSLPTRFRKKTYVQVK